MRKPEFWDFHQLCFVQASFSIGEIKSDALPTALRARLHKKVNHYRLTPVASRLECNSRY